MTAALRRESGGLMRGMSPDTGRAAPARRSIRWNNIRARDKSRGDSIFVKTIETDDTVEMPQPVTTPTIGMITIKFVALLTVIVTALALAWSR